MKAMLPGVLWVTGVYFYFLIFAQFAFLELLNGSNVGKNDLRLVMGSMALSGIVGSILAWKLRYCLSAMAMMRIAAILCGLMAFLAAWKAGVLGSGVMSAIAFGIGMGLGVLTVMIAANLPRLMSRAYLGAALGTGLAYMLSNTPWIFQASAETQSYLVGCLVMMLALVRLDFSVPSPSDCSESVTLRFASGLVCFTMLVWLDSAAFYIIQHTREMKLGTWGQDYLWRNAALHLLVALVSGWLLAKKKIGVVLFAAFALLGIAGLMASEPAFVVASGWLYPMGVSLYSVALVLFPAVLLHNSGSLARAAVLFAVAGWLGSTMGIGMAKDLHKVPITFVLAAGAVMLVATAWPLLKKRFREVLICAGAAVLLLLLAGLGRGSGNTGKHRAMLDDHDAAILGREVYLSEGCIHCHSRYVRPGTRDELLWGPGRRLEELTRESPVLIGNRRQGPDLLQVGLRRSKAWMREHFKDPQRFVHGTSMPGYGYLFGDERGEALVEYLAQYDPDDMVKRQRMIYEWQWPGLAMQEALQGETRSDQGENLFSKHCAMCHGDHGMGDGELAKLWLKPPANLVEGPFAFTPDNGGSMMARVIKFGIPGTDMPGHELFNDGELGALVGYVQSLRARKPVPPKQ